eukprot:jgi/Galph1/3358/GphlegSOOS_G2017.1
MSVYRRSNLEQKESTVKQGEGSQEVSYYVQDSHCWLGKVTKSVAKLAHKYAGVLKDSLLKCLPSFFTRCKLLFSLCPSFSGQLDLLRKIWCSEFGLQIVLRSVAIGLFLISVCIAYAFVKFIWQLRSSPLFVSALAAAPAALLCPLFFFCLVLSRFLYYRLFSCTGIETTYYGNTLRSLYYIGQELRYQRTLYRLCLTDRDFTDQDYELLLELDNEPGVQAMRQFIEGVSPEIVKALPCYRYQRTKILECRRRSVDESNVRSTQLKYWDRLVLFFAKIRRILILKCDAEIPVGGKSFQDDVCDSSSVGSFREIQKSMVSYQKRSNTSPNSQNVHCCTENDIFLSCSSSTDLCPICLEEFIHEELIRILPCGHEFHNDCIYQWLTKRGKCPVCKYQLS